MVLLHIELASTATASNTVRVNLPHPIPSQVVKLVKSVVTQKHNASGQNANDMLYLSVPWLSNYEVTSSTSTSLLPISYDNSVNRTEADHDVKLKAEDISRAFDISVFKDADGTPFNLQTNTNNAISSIHLFFEYGSNQTFH